MFQLQRTPEWFQARVGKVTASRISDVIAEPTKKAREDGSMEALTRRNYRRQLALEQYYNTPQDSAFQSYSMAQGIAMEAEARNAYRLAKGLEVEEVSFIPHPNITLAGASPDGLVGFSGLLEIKCPEANAMFEALTKYPIDKKYRDQVMWQMACCPDRSWADITFYRAGCDIEIVRVERDDQYINTLEEAVREFLREVEADRQRLAEARR